MEQVILVDINDNQLGVMEKMEAHQKGLMHRAISVFIFNSQGQMLLQKRALHKYHSPGLWSNACCTHPRPSETQINAAHRRIKEEMGMSCSLHWKFKFNYITHFDNGLTENELDHVFVGYSNDVPCLNPEEVVDYKYMSINDINRDVSANPSNYTSWFKICYQRLLEELNMPSSKIS